MPAKHSSKPCVCGSGSFCHLHKTYRRERHGHQASNFLLRDHEDDHAISRTVDYMPAGGGHRILRSRLDD